MAIEKQPLQLHDIVTSPVLPEQSVDLMLKRLQLEELQEKKQAKVDAIESNRKMRETTISQIKVAEEVKRQGQLGCDHEKPNKMPNLNGQKDHQGTYHLVCSRCQAHFTQHTCPPHLWQKLNFDVIGGPQN